MIRFSNIVSHLQVHIAKKMDYYDQIEFESSSKNGNEILCLIKYRGVVEVQAAFSKENIRLWMKKARSAWNQSAEFNYSDNRLKKKFLPSMAVTSYFTIEEGYSLECLMEFLETSNFVESSVILRFRRQIPHAMQIFAKISEVLTISKFNADCTELDPHLFSLSQLQKVPWIRTNIDGIEHENLIKIKASIVVFVNEKELGFPILTANEYLQQWFRKERSIELFQLWLRLPKISEPNTHEILFHNLPCSMLWKYTNMENCCTMFHRNRNGYESNLSLDEKNEVYSIDRGDKKLLILLHKNGYLNINGIEAREYTDQSSILYLYNSYY